MKGSKKLMTVLLVLAIVTALSAGTLAVYTTTLDSNMKTTVNAKQFYLGEGNTWAENVAVSIAPSETYEPTDVYDVVNYKGFVLSEVPIDLEITPDAQLKALIDTCRGMKVTLFYNTGDGDNFEVAHVWDAENTGKYDYSAAHGNLPAGIPTSIKFKLGFTWVDDGGAPHNAAQGQGKVLQFTFTGTQATEENV